MGSQPNSLSSLSFIFLEELEDEMAEKLHGPETESGDGDKHACRRMAN
jgi:hypothetical protein